MFVRAFSFLASLRLTVVLLALSIILVFFGTLGQVTDGLYDAQARYFKSWFTTWQPTAGSWFHLPLPGGYLLGTSLLVNLLAAHYKRFKFTWKKSGIFLTHIGIVLLLVGQLATDMFATESYLRVEEGETRNYSEGHRENELAVIDVTDATIERVVAFPETSVVKGNTLSHPSLPFQVRVRDYAPNSSYSPRGPRSGGEAQAPAGIATGFTFKPTRTTAAMNSRNIPFAVVEIEGAKAISDDLARQQQGLIDAVHAMSRQVQDERASMQKDMVALSERYQVDTAQRMARLEKLFDQMAQLSAKSAQALDQHIQRQESVAEGLPRTSYWKKAWEQVQDYLSRSRQSADLALMAQALRRQTELMERIDRRLSQHESQDQTKNPRA